MKKLVFPDRIVNFTRTYLDPIVSSTAPPVQNPMQRGDPIVNNLRTRLTQRGPRGAGDQPQVLMPQDDQDTFIQQLQQQFNQMHQQQQQQLHQQQIVNEENVRALTEMGFDDATARRALEASNNDITAATELLLTGE
jgi:NACalpha-BTF3-like transcription factor